jgi:Flp pilus assembly protein TadB
MTPLAALLGATLGVGLLLLAAGMRRTPPRTPRPRAVRGRGRWAALRPATRRLLLAGVASGLLAWLVTGWLIAVVLVPLLVVGLPALMRPPTPGASIPRLEALQEWTRGLAGVLTVGVGLEQALIMSARSAPAPIAAEVTALAARLRARIPTAEALRWFADELDDATADLMVLSLTRAATKRGQGLAAILESLASSVAHEVTIRRSVDAERAKLRTTTRAVTAITLLVMGGLFASGTYVAPYRTLVGSLVLALLLTGYLGALLWMRRLGTPRPPTRLIVPIRQEVTA